MSLNDETMAVVRQAYDCFEKRDIPGILSLIGKECDWRAPGPTGEMAWAGTYHGPEGVRQFFDKLDNNLEFLEFTPTRFMSDGGMVMVMGHERDRVKSTGKVFEVDWAHCFEVKNGKITRFQDYQDTAAIQAALH